MRDLNQLLLKFDYSQNFKDQDFYVSRSNKHVFSFLNRWPNWERNFLNISGEKFCGKTHLINIFLKKNKGIKLETKKIKNKDIKELKIFENIVLEDLNEDVDENLIYTLLNTIDQDNKFIIITSLIPIVDINFSLNDLKSRTKNFLLQNIESPDDDLMFALILKNLSDRQIVLNKKIIVYIVKRVERSYSKIFDFIYKIDELSLKKKKPIDFKIVKEVLGE